MRDILVSKDLAMRLSGMTNASIRQAVKRGRLVSGDALIDETVHKGIAFDSLASYCGWSSKTCDEILISHMVPKGARAYLTVRDPSEVRAMTYGDVARRAEVEATYTDEGE